MYAIRSYYGMTPIRPRGTTLTPLTATERERFDFAVIAHWIPEGEHVLDLGCGDGRLLRYSYNFV